MKAKDITYRSAVDAWIVLLLLSPVFYYLYLLVSGSSRTGLGEMVGGILVLVFLLSLGFPCRYTLTDRSLIIRCGIIGFFFKQEIDFRKIENVTLSRNPLASAAWSLKRVSIEYEGGFAGFTLISPKDRTGFIAELNRRREMCGYPE